MKTKLLFSSVFLSQWISFAAQAETQIVPDTAAPKKSLPYQAFPIQDPKTGQPMNPEDQVTMGDGRKMKAKDYYQNLNESEKYLSNRGYTLRDKKTQLGVVAELNSTEALKAKQLKETKGRMGSSSPITVDGSSGTSTGVVTTPGGLSPVPRPCEIPAGGVSDEKSFNASLGNRASAELAFSAVGTFAARCNTLSGSAVGSAVGTLFNNTIPIFRAEGRASFTRGVAGSSFAEVQFAGKKVFEDDQPRVASVGFQKTFSQDFQASITARAVVAFIPVSATVGAKGGASITFALTSNGADLTGSVLPSMRIAAFAEGGVDIFFAKAGFGASLLLLDIGAPTRFNAAIAEINGKRFARGSFEANSRLRTLDGRIFAFAELNLIFFRPRFEIDLIKFSGFEINGILFNGEKLMELPAQATGGGLVGRPVIIAETLH